ncbi:hypothetical protein ACQKB9_01285, partial [Escherichia coli]|uniref:hypothetical protein n=1 Tax=Escherichia coli TaxID=562 RepID=UPI003D093454
HPAGMPQVTAAQVLHRHTRWDCWVSHRELPVQYSRQTRGSFKEGANKQVISSQADSLIKISRIWADFFPANTSNQPI